MPRWLWITAAIVALFVAIFALSDILLPFVAGLAVAYFLDPAADILERWRLPRWLAAFIIILLFFLVLIGLFMAMWPIAASQASGFVESWPNYVAKIKPLLVKAIELAGPERAKEFAGQFSGKAVQVASEAVTQIVDQGFALFNIVSLVLITPVVAFYLLRDWDQMTAKIDSWLPRKYEATIKSLFRESDQVLAGFVRGQILVVLAEMLLYALGWSILGLQHGLLLGILAGALAFIPFVGPLFGVGLAMLVAFGQFDGDMLQLALVFSVFLIVQAIEGAVLQPRFIGERVGLSAVWVLLAIFAGGELLGFVGVLLALPIAAVVAVLARFALRQYLDSDFYGKQADETPSAQQPQKQ